MYHRKGDSENVTISEFNELSLGTTESHVPDEFDLMDGVSGVTSTKEEHCLKATMDRKKWRSMFAHNRKERRA